MNAQDIICMVHVRYKRGCLPQQTPFNLKVCLKDVNLIDRYSELQDGCQLQILLLVISHEKQPIKSFIKV